MAKKISIPCLEVKQPIGSFYLGVIGAKDLFEISYADVRRLEKRDVELYLGIQRPLSGKRVKEIKKYVKGIDATFPTSVIIAIESKHASFNKKSKSLSITRASDVAKIIDGQHRIAGLEDEDNNRFQINVVVFIDMDIEDQAMTFATINLAQTKVNRSLVYDLFDFTKRPSPQKSAHTIARLLNYEPQSPFEGRIKILGTADEEAQVKQLLTQAVVVEMIIRLISGSNEKAEEDREKIKLGLSLDRAEPGSRLIFRNLFIDKKDAQIARILWNYFMSVRKKWKAWNDVNSRGNILPRTNGFRALMRFLPDIHLSITGKTQRVPSENDFVKVMQKVKIKDADFVVENYSPGTSGESKLLKEMQSYLLVSK